MMEQRLQLAKRVLKPFASKSGERPQQGHLDYALSRSFWAEQHPPTPTEEDNETLRRLVLERLPLDLGTPKLRREERMQ